ncbi:cysteine-rich CWC family protein [Actimicrobium sp. CCI2.3]|uniref:cysteine-rich CWC family protein n=1 Tax=Actimicrobium sp. CCI2.3 TaxID=3048616 RepID=UPI002AB488EA|nr:cysteine-rich CWC family protein [Actimicrobium sp. CCI2.3]MDY7576634.1 cysteine-rich CWC family protein [Actimicrobium sp. CCI2.3]MEB0021235.1 cysteine-rich CWC family protein [Actimicrobium sp. CCI2.3]
MSTCPRCDTEFRCGMVDPATAGPCWRMLLPNLPVSPPGSDVTRCFCPACLRQLLDQLPDQLPSPIPS